MEPDPYVVTEYESGWYVEEADPKDVEKSRIVNGPFPTQADAEMMASKMRHRWVLPAAYKFAAKLQGRS